jgi:hypothetical protein
VIAKTASMMIHDAFGFGIGNAVDLRQLADLLDQQSDNIAGIYADRSGKPVNEWRDAMRAETWYVGQQAVDAGLADVVQAGNATPADTFDLSVFAKRPAPVASTAAGGPASPAPATDDSADLGWLDQLDLEAFKEAK